MGFGPELPLTVLSCAALQLSKTGQYDHLAALSTNSRIVAFVHYLFCASMLYLKERV